MFVSMSSVKKSYSPPSISHKIVAFEKSISEGSKEKKLSFVTLPSIDKLVVTLLIFAVFNKFSLLFFDSSKA